MLKPNKIISSLGTPKNFLKEIFPLKAFFKSERSGCVVFCVAKKKNSFYAKYVRNGIPPMLSMFWTVMRANLVHFEQRSAHTKMIQDVVQYWFFERLS